MNRPADPPASLVVDDPGPLTTVQDEGRPGHAAIGVGRSGAADRAAYRLAARLLGNHRGTPALEITLGGLALRVERDVTVVATGARCPGAPHNAPTRWTAGEVVRFGTPSAGLRSYLAVRGGLDLPAVLGSCSTDVLGAIGPAPLAAGDRLAVGDQADGYPGIDEAVVPDPGGGVVEVRVSPGPRRDWFDDEAWSSLCEQEFTVGSDSNRVGVRVEGRPLLRRRSEELASEGMLRGAVQVPPSGRPVVFLADHPVTGGYPVIGYVADADVDRCAQLRPGQGLRFRPQPVR